MALAENTGHHQNTKHIHVKSHFIRKMVELNEVNLQYVPTKEQVADVLTKLLGRNKFPNFVKGMGMD